MDKKWSREVRMRVSECGMKWRVMEECIEWRGVVGQSGGGGSDVREYRSNPGRSGDSDVRELDECGAME